VSNQTGLVSTVSPPGLSTLDIFEVITHRLLVATCCDSVVGDGSDDKNGITARQEK